MGVCQSANRHKLAERVPLPWQQWVQADGGSESWPRGWNLDNLATRPRLCVGDSRERRVAGSNVLGTVGVPNLDN